MHEDESYQALCHNDCHQCSAPIRHCQSDTRIMIQSHFSLQRHIDCILSVRFRIPDFQFTLKNDPQSTNIAYQIYYIRHFGTYHQSSPALYL